MKKVLVNGIRYELNKVEGTATVICLKKGAYSGDINIPSTISYKPFLQKERIYKVVQIAEKAFNHAVDIESITLPPSITYLCSRCFLGCSSLKSITLPDTILEIKTETFQDCFSLISIAIPNTVTTIDDYAFRNCRSLTSIFIPKNIKSIGHRVFLECNSLNSILWDAESCSPTINKVELGDKIQWFYGPFADIAKQIISFKFGEHVENIPSYTCYDMSKIVSITIPKNVKSIRNAFRGCKSLQSIIWDATACSTTALKEMIDNKTNYFFGPFADVAKQITSFSIGKNVEKLPDLLCYDMENLKSVVIPNNILEVGGGIFCKCKNLTNIIILSKKLQSLSSFHYVTSEKYKVYGAQYNYYSVDHYLGFFEDCSSLVSITMFDSLSAIEKNAFRNCSSLSSIFIKTESIEAFCRSTINRLLSEHLDGKIKRKILIKKENIYEELTSVVIPSSVTNIKDNTFFSCKSISSITLPDTTFRIGDLAFSLCSFSTIAIPKDVKSIGLRAFAGCNSITSIVWNAKACTCHCYRGEVPFGAIAEQITSFKFGDEVKVIPESLCCSLKNVSSINIPEGVVNISKRAFRDCSSLATITIPCSVESIGEDAFAYCTALTTITIPESVMSIGNNAFLNCSSLISIVVDNNNLIYDSRDYCNAIIETATNTLIIACQNTIIPNSITNIGKYAFYNYSSFTSIIIPNSVISIEEWAFSRCSSLSAIIVPDSVVSIGHAAFRDCTSLTSITLPNSIKVIEEWTFFNCSSLNSITIPEGVTIIGKSAFSDCASLKSITLPKSLTSIEEWAFSGCTSVISVTLGNGVSKIGEYAFINCSSLQSINVPVGKKEEYCKLGLEQYRDIIQEVNEWGKTFEQAISWDEPEDYDDDDIEYLREAAEWAHEAEYWDQIIEEEMCDEDDEEEYTILFNIAKGYEYGIGVQKNLAQAILVYAQATEKGSAEAAYHLGELCEKGEGLSQDYQQAIDWYTKASHLSHPNAETRKQYCEQMLRKKEL